MRLEQARKIATATEWSGDARVNFTTCHNAAAVLERRLAELEAAARDVIDHAFWCHSVCAGAVPKTLLSKVRELSKQIPRQVSPQNDS